MTPPRDNHGMDCETWRVAMSAVMDGEDPGVPVDALEAHPTRCSSCRVWHKDAEALNRAVKVRPAAPVPDLVHEVLAVIGGFAPRRAQLSSLRLGLVALAVLQFGLAISFLAFGKGVAGDVHSGRDLASLDLALGAGFLLAAWQPERARGMLPLGLALLVGLLVVIAIDLLGGRTTPAGESAHTFQLLGLVQLWLLSRAHAPRVAVRPA